MAKKKKTSSRKPNLFRLAASHKGFKAAKRAEAKAAARKKRLWKKAIAAAKRKMRKRR